MRDDKKEVLQKPSYANIAAIGINKTRDFNRNHKQTMENGKCQLKSHYLFLLFQ